MLNFTINSIGVYREAEKHHQTIHCPWLNISLSGLIYYRLKSPDGRVIASHDENTAYMHLGHQGMMSEFEYGKNRENWVVMFGEIPLSLSKKGTPILRDGDTNIEMPASRKLTPEYLPTARERLRRLLECFRNPLPVNRFKAKLIIAEFISDLVNTPGDGLGETPAEELKRLIDADTSFERTIRDICATCMYSEDHLRVLFKKEFKMSPRQYRNQKRMAKVMEYISGTRMSLKEIADATGFEHPSHLSMAFKNAFGSTPSEAVAKYRYRSSR